METMTQKAQKDSSSVADRVAEVASAAAPWSLEQIAADPRNKDSLGTPVIMPDAHTSPSDHFGQTVGNQTNGQRDPKN